VGGLPAVAESSTWGDLMEGPPARKEGSTKWGRVRDPPAI